MWKNIVGQGRPQLTIWCMSTNTQSEYVILTDFTLQKWSQEPCTCTLPVFLLFCECA